jgi:hypothetical protein
MVEDYGDRCEPENRNIDKEHTIAEDILLHRTPAFTAEDILFNSDYLNPVVLRCAQAGIHGPGCGCAK